MVHLRPDTRPRPVRRGRAWFLRRRTGAPPGAGLRHGATLRLSGAAHQRAPGRIDTIGAMRRVRAASLPSANAPLWPAGGWLLAADRTTRTANAAGLLANAATVTGRNGLPGGPGGDAVTRVTGPMTGRFAQVTGQPTPVQRLESAVLPAALAREAGEHARFEHTYGGPLGRRCCTFLLYCLFDLFEFRF